MTAGIEDHHRFMGSERTAVRDYLYFNRIPMSSAADDLGVSVSMISHWLAGRCVSQRVEEYFRDKMSGPVPKGKNNGRRKRRLP